MTYVIKYDGNKALRKNCRRINKKFYEKNVDCFLINGKWNRINNGLIAFDNETQKWVRKDQVELVEGFIGKGKKGFFTRTDKNVKSHNAFYLNEDVAISNGLVESLDSEYFVSKSTTRKKGINANYGKRGYNMTDGDISSLSKSHKELFNGSLRNPKLMKFLRGFNFGFEFETANGYIRKQKLKVHGVKPLLDGSLRKDGIEPFEFTTIPYNGTKGVAAVRSFCDVLNMHCTFDHRCSLHIHISGHSTQRKDVLRLYKILYDIQNEVFQMFPMYKTNPEYIGKSKNYCQKLEKIIKSDFDIEKDLNPALSRLFRTLTGKQLSSDTSFSTGYKLFEGTQKWNIPGRYRWVNLIPLLFGKSKTVEFRIHEPTFDKNAVTNWLLFCISILKYSMNADDRVFNKKVTLSNILSNSEYGKDLEQYYISRVKQYEAFNKKEQFNKFSKENIEIV